MLFAAAIGYTEAIHCAFSFLFFVAAKVSSIDQTNQALNDSLPYVSRIIHTLNMLPICPSFEVFAFGGWGGVKLKKNFPHLRSFSSPFGYTNDIMNAVQKVNG